MTKLKLGPLPDDKPVKVTLELPAPLRRDLVTYANYPNRLHAQEKKHAGTKAWSVAEGGSGTDDNRVVGTA